VLKLRFPAGRIAEGVLVGDALVRTRTVEKGDGHRECLEVQKTERIPEGAGELPGLLPVEQHASGGIGVKDEPLPCRQGIGRYVLEADHAPFVKLEHGRSAASRVEHRILGDVFPATLPEPALVRVAALPADVGVGHPAAEHPPHLAELS
jgi:hypothetical protein